MRQLLRIADACRNGFTTLVQTTLEQSRIRTHAVQWELLQPILIEVRALHPRGPGHEPEPDTADRRRPRRVLHPRPGLKHPAKVAMAWLVHRPGLTAPVIGPRTVEDLDVGAAAVDLELDPEALDRLDDIFPGFKTSPEDYAW